MDNVNYSTVQELKDGTIIRLRDPAPPLPPEVRYIITKHLYRNVKMSRRQALTAAWKGTSFLTTITLSQPRRHGKQEQ